ncbi:MAG: hypothetical protein LBG11_09875 [Bifidobacteriaceae bacterium]|nr:hypothetical protein [Bifidobacteriaceae bacterium]
MTATVPRYRRKSWTIPTDLIDEIERRVPPGKMSAYVTEALRRQQRRDNLSALVDEIVEKTGPADEAEVKKFQEAMR